MTECTQAPRQRRLRGSRARLAVLIAAAAFLAAGCIDMEMHFTVRDDGSGTSEVSIFFNESTLLTLAALSDAPPSELCEELLAEAELEDGLGVTSEGLDWDIETHAGAGECGTAMSTSWTAAESESVLGTLEEEGGPSLTRLEDGGWRFEMDMSEVIDDMNEGMTEDESGDFGLDLGFALPTIVVSVNLPGDPVEDNATERNGSEFRWELDMADAGTGELPAELFAETAPAPGMGATAVVGIIVAVAVGALVLVLLIRRSRRARSAAPAAAALPEDGTAAEPDAPAHDDAETTDDSESSAELDADGDLAPDSNARGER